MSSCSSLSFSQTLRLDNIGKPLELSFSSFQDFRKFCRAVCMYLILRSRYQYEVKHTYKIM